MRVRDIMTTEVVTASPSDSLKDAARKMTTAGVSGLPVVDDGLVIGIITEADFLAKEAERGRTPGLLDTFLHRQHPIVEAENVGEAMTSFPFVTSPEETVSAAAREMADKGVKRLPVVDADGRLEGVVSRGDIVNAFARPDEILIDVIREDIVKRILWVDPDSIGIDVAGGVVSLSGQLETKSEVNFFVELVRRIEGVVRVDNALSWAADDTKHSLPLS